MLSHCRHRPQPGLAWPPIDAQILISVCTVLWTWPRGDFRYNLSHVLEACTISCVRLVPLLPLPEHNALSRDYVCRLASVKLWNYGNLFADYYRLRFGLFSLAISSRSRSLPLSLALSVFNVSGVLRFWKAFPIGLTYSWTLFSWPRECANSLWGWANELQIVQIFDGDAHKTSWD